MAMLEEVPFRYLREGLGFLNFSDLCKWNKHKRAKYPELHSGGIVFPLFSVEANNLMFSYVLVSEKSILVSYLILMVSSSVAPRGVSSFWVASSREKALASEQQLQPWYSNVLWNIINSQAVIPKLQS